MKFDREIQQPDWLSQLLQLDWLMFLVEKGSVFPEMTPDDITG